MAIDGNIDNVVAGLSGPRPIPVVWLLGKVQSGKSSIIRAITGHSAAEIGSGFKPLTRTSQTYDFPADHPLIRFLDTRGLGEASYDPSEDVRSAESRANLLLVTMRAMDRNQTDVVEAVSALRLRHPSWPLVVAQTCLHEGYARGQDHIIPYPFLAHDGDAAAPAVPRDCGRDELDRHLRDQRTLFAGLGGGGPVCFVPIDFTQAAEGLFPVDYGLAELGNALVQVAPAALREAIAALPGLSTDPRASVCDPIIRNHAIAAAGADLVPLAGIVAASAVQARLLQQLAEIYGVSWDRRTTLEFVAALGSSITARTLVGLGVRQLTKFIPLYGQTVAAATSASMSFAVTFALGKAAVHFLSLRERGNRPDVSTASVYQDGLRQALVLARDMAFGGSQKKDAS